MPRGPRLKSETGIYHVMVRGVDRADIYFDNQDRRHYLKNLQTKKQEYNIKIYGFCLMPNHNHLLVKDSDGNLSGFMKSMGISHANFINWKRGRVGHLYQGRYRSEIILTDEDLLNCLRYIHNNPQKAGLVANLSDFHWSSFNLYLSMLKTELVDQAEIMNMFSADQEQALVDFREFSQAECDEEFLDIFDAEVVLEDEYLKIVDILSDNNLTAKQLKFNSSKFIRSKVVKEIMERTKLPAEQLAGFLGVSKSTIYRWK